MFNIGYLLSRVTSSAHSIDANKIALVFRNNRLTYMELNNHSNRIANKLIELGIKKGDRVAALLYNCAEYWEIYFAVAKIGAVLVPLNFRLAAPELEFAISDSTPQLLIFGESFRKTIQGIESQLPSVKYYALLSDEAREVLPYTRDSSHFPYNLLYKASDNEPKGEAVGLDDDLFIMYTSGTTGRPKGAVWTHGNSLWFSVSQIVAFGLQENDVTFLSGPMYHVGSLQDMSMPTFHMGGTCVMLDSGGFNAQRVLNILADEKVTKALLFPVMLYDILASQDLGNYDLDNLKQVLTGGESVPLSTIHRFQEKLPAIDLVQLYGLTEGTAIATACLSEYAVSKAGSIGKPLLNVDVKVIDEKGDSLGAGQVGEILVKSPVVSKGYWQRPEANVETFVDGWCHTGDLGRFDEDGFLYIEGRKKDMIISGAENIYPAEIENVLFQHPKIHEAAVIGVPDPRWGEAVMAAIVLRPGETMTEAEVIEYCKENLASYKKPRYVAFVDTLPRTPSQKVQKFILRECYKHMGEEGR